MQTDEDPIVQTSQTKRETILKFFGSFLFIGLLLLIVVYLVSPIRSAS